MNKKFIGILISIVLIFLIGAGCISEYPMNHNQNKSKVTNVIWYPTTSITREEYNRLQTGDIVAGIEVTGGKKARLNFNFSDNNQDAVIVFDDLHWEFR